ncbi:uncharacterized protein Z520_12202 [Fonsecaea multimorphosa CBS 102226]|uniref:Glutathione S-transferase n=1 Tax=Fonsecaea multimorphosa CBS 102226 TaxID=1442371 RepID=A0A0D2K6Y7_9EURO|nr:uncharacterized protein Z520_12202 [Fonsecaea multimorphosa CBS 102226]KIX92118.1 hypothetical protein Z520_12202 [Fonsecaea multimorphosa CBS 102226]OAL17481.1 hypothetical protein AYO22_11613 [Fonsecaea multimorphosa]
MTTPHTPNITLYTDSTPNGLKISIALEELGLPYKVEHIDISTNRQKEPWFLEINPNGRIPAMTDTFRGDGQKIRLFEAGGILQYLIDEYDSQDHKISYPRGTREFYEMVNWTFWQNAGLGPMQGQANHFVRYAPQKIEYGMNRYVNETRRLYGVLDKHLQTSKSGFIVGDHISVADITTIGWVIYAGWAGVDIDEFPNLKKWEDMMSSRPAVKRGCDVPKPLTIKERLKDKAGIEEYAKKASQWIVQGMQDDAKKK